MAPFTKVLFLAMDAGDKFLIRQWAADGTLPNLRSMLASGLVGETLSLEGFYEGSTWPSFYTGMTPGHHGFHSLTQLHPGTYEFYRCYPGKFIKPEPFWNYLSSVGRRVAILDVPLTGISRGLNGIQMVEWASHDGVYGFQTWPEELKREVLIRFGRHPLKRSCDSFRRSRHGFRSFRDQLIKGVQKKAELTIHYLKEGKWDFFGQVFSESHCVGHQCWHLHDPHHPSYDPEYVTYIGDPIREVYKTIDSAIGKILEHVDDNTIIFFLASHRMTHAFGGNFLLAEILKKLNLTMRLPGRISLNKSPSRIKKFYDILARSWRKMPERFRTTFEPFLLPFYDLLMDRIKGGDLLPPLYYFPNIDIRNSKCFPLLNGTAVSGIRINLWGREPNGIIQPGQEFKDFCEEISRKFLSIVDCDTGKALVKGVKKTGELYEGESLDDLPDILIEWNDEKLLGNLAIGDRQGSRLRISSKMLGVIEGANGYARTGDHRPEGLFIAIGPDINAGALDRTISIMDFAPTFANLLGVQMPDTDGEPIVEILQTR